MQTQTTILSAAICLALAGCASTNSYLAARTSTVEMYHIFDIQTNAEPSTVAQAATDGLSQNTNEVTSNMPLQLGKTVPEQPGRFTLQDITSQMRGTGMGALMQMAAMQNGGVGLKAANCEGAVWHSRAQRAISGSNKLTVYNCLYRYKSGYHLNTYAVFQKEEGGLYQVSRNIAYSMVGTPEEWVNKTLIDMVRSIEAKSNARVAYVEGQPKIDNLPWVDKFDSNIRVGKHN